MKAKQQLFIIFGPEAVGKMTVGRILESKLDFKLFHDHLAIEFVRQFFDLNHENFWPLLAKIRRMLFVDMATSYDPGFIITYVWDLDQQSDRQYIEAIIELFREKLWQINFVELEASTGTRLRRNIMEDRIAEKPTLSDTARSEALLLQMDDHRLNTSGDFEYNEPFLKINTTNISAEEVATMIIDHFDLKVKE